MSRPELADGLYAITAPGDATPEALARQVEQALRGGARLVQYRDKHTAAATRKTRASALLALCRRHGVALVINDDVELAATLGAHGVHLGGEDMAIAAARRRLGPHALIGASCYNRLEHAHAAVAGGADYVAFGRFFASQSKPAALPADLSLLARARRDLPVPVVAIGGITPANGAALLAAGANLLAAIHGVFGQPDIEAAARAYTNLFDKVKREQ